MKLYLDTSVYGGCFDEGMEASLDLIDWINLNDHVRVYYSDIIVSEINRAHPSIKDRLNGALGNIKNSFFIKKNEESDFLALEYIAMGVLSNKSMADAQHIAVASLNQIDYILSWNFKHMVDREKLFRRANEKLKVHQPHIINPEKFLSNEKRKK